MKKYISNKKSVNEDNIKEFLQNDQQVDSYFAPDEIIVITKEYKRVYRKAKTYGDDVLYEKIKMLSRIIGGEFGWAISSIDDDKGIKKLFNKIERSVIKSIYKGYDAETVDRKVLQVVSPLALSYVLRKIKNNCFEENVEKIQEAYNLFSFKKFYACANILATIIESESIKQLLYEYKKSGEDGNLPQCWQCFMLIANKYFVKEYFNNEPYIRKANVENFKSLLDKVDYNTFIEDKEIFRILTTTYALLKFFENSDWRETKDNLIPSSINRHWLAHGMYHKRDVKEFDCIKLIVLLYQLTFLYKNLRDR